MSLGVRILTYMWMSVLRTKEGPLIENQFNTGAKYGALLCAIWQY